MNFDISICIRICIELDAAQIMEGEGYQILKRLDFSPLVSSYDPQEVGRGIALPTPT